MSVRLQARIAKLERRQKPGEPPKPPIAAIDAVLTMALGHELTAKEQALVNRWLPTIDAIVQTGMNEKVEP